MARLGNAGSMCSKTYSEYFGTLERYLSRAPAGIMWSVVILSPDLYADDAFDLLGHLVVGWRRADVWSPGDFDVFVSVFGEDEHGVVDEELGWHARLWGTRCLLFWGQ